MDSRAKGRAAVGELNNYMDKSIADTQDIIRSIERMDHHEKARFAALLKSYLERHLQDGTAYTDVHTACMIANPGKYGVFRKEFLRMMNMLPQPR